MFAASLTVLLRVQQRRTKHGNHLSFLHVLVYLCRSETEQYFVADFIHDTTQHILSESVNFYIRYDKNILVYFSVGARYWNSHQTRLVSFTRLCKDTMQVKQETFQLCDYRDVNTNNYENQLIFLKQK